MNVAPIERRKFRSELLNHMLIRVHSTPYETDPFPHVIIHDLFPSHVYRQIQNLMPAPSLYDKFNAEKHAGYNGVSNRDHFKLTAEKIDLLTGPSRQLWYDVRDALGSLELKQAIFKKLADGLAFRYGVSPAEAAETEGYPLPELFRETQGYRIAPHPDTRRKVVTMQISLAADDSQKNLGTGFYRRSLNPAAWLREPRGFDVVKRAPFLPNCAYAFVVLNTLTKKSWHGRETLEAQQGVRNSILNIYYARREDASGDLVRNYFAAAA